MITTTDPGGLVMIVTLTKHKNTQMVQQQQHALICRRAPLTAWPSGQSYE